VAQDWPGNQCFLQDGHWVLSNKWAGASATLLIICTYEVVFLVFTAWGLDGAWRWTGLVSGCETAWMSRDAKLHGSDGWLLE
jgi:hypothetical protein